MKVLDRRQVTLDGRRPQLTNGKGVRNVLEQLPRVEHTVTTMLEKNGQNTTHPNVYPCTKMRLISAFRRGRNGALHEPEANTEVQTSGRTERT